MSHSRFSTHQLALAGIIAGIYAGLTLLLPIPQYLGVQFRIAEAMTVLPFLCPAAIPGLTIGCFLANLLGSPMVMDWVPPVICNAVIVGAEIAWFFPEGMSFWAAYGLNAFTVGIGELAVCCLLGLPLLKWAERTPALLKRV